MDYSRRCPKCDSRAIVKVVGSKLNQGQIIPLHKWSWKNAVLDRFICTDCGYTEEYVQLTASFKKWADQALGELPREEDDFV